MTDVHYVPQAVKNLLSTPMLVLKVSTIGDTKDNKTTKKNVVSMILDSIKGKDYSTISTRGLRDMPQKVRHLKRQTEI